MQKSTLFIVFLLVAGGSAGLFDGINDVVGDVVTALVNFIQGAQARISNIVDNILASVKSSVQSLQKTSLGPLIQSLQTALSSIQPSLKAILSTVSALPATAASAVNLAVQNLVKSSEDALTTIGTLLVPVLTQLENDVQKVESYVANATKVLADSLAQSKCGGVALANINATINNIPKDAEAIIIECLKPAQAVISNVLSTVQNITDVITVTDKTISACGSNAICLAKIGVQTSAKVIVITANVAGIVTSIPTVIPATETCLTKEVTGTIIGNVQDIASNILNCIAN